MKNELIELFLKDVTECGLYFNNAIRVKHECLALLAENGYPVLMTTKGEPQFEFLQDKQVLALVNEAYEAAFTYIRTRAGAEEKLRANLKRLDEQRKAEARYYEKHGTKGEF